MFKAIFREIGLSDICASIYNTLYEEGFLSARQLADHLSLPRPTIYDNLMILINNGLAVEKNAGSKRLFGIDEIKNVKRLLREKIDMLHEKELVVNELVAKRPPAESFEPKIKFFTGADGIKQVLRDLLWHDHIETLTMWPISDMVGILGQEYLEQLNRRRIRQNISIRGVWPRNKAVDFKHHPYLGVGGGHLRHLRLAPKGMTWNMSYWQYADKVAFISSKKEGFGFVVHSLDFVGLIKAQFEQIWPLSTPIRPQPQFTDNFLKTL